MPGRTIGGAGKFAAMQQMMKKKGDKKGKRPMPPKAKSRGGKVGKKDAGALSNFDY